MKNNLRMCPRCQQITSIMPISDIYFSLLENKITDEKLKKLSSQQKKDLFKFLNPPSFNRRPIWNILPPDILFGTLILLLVFSILYGYFEGRISLLNGTIPLGLVLIFYGAIRKKLQNTFNKKTKDQQEIAAALSLKADEWSDSCYCFTDQVIFHPKNEKIFTLIEFFARMHPEDAV